MEICYSFASDNTARTHPDIFRAMEAANIGSAGSYGDGGDPYTDSAKKEFERHFGGAEVFLSSAAPGQMFPGLRP